jgi:hypothetical protein
MAYMLYKYIRRKTRETKEKKAAHDITGESHLTPELYPTERPKPERHETLPVELADHAHARLKTPIQEEKTEKSRKLDAEARRMRAYRWRMVLGLILPNFLASVDVTIVAPAIPTISSHFSLYPSQSVDAHQANALRPSFW